MDGISIGPWIVGEFHHDPSDNSLWWEEQHTETRQSRLTCTGPNRQGVYVSGIPVLPSDIDFPEDLDEARTHYLKIAEHVIELWRQLNNQQDN